MPFGADENKIPQSGYLNAGTVGFLFLHMTGTL